MDEWEVVPRVAAAVAMKAQDEGVARVSRTREDVYLKALYTIKETRRAMEVMMRERIIR